MGFDPPILQQLCFFHGSSKPRWQHAAWVCIRQALRVYVCVSVCAPVCSGPGSIFFLLSPLASDLGRQWPQRGSSRPFALIKAGSLSQRSAL